MASNSPSRHHHHTKHLPKTPNPQYDVIVIGSGNAGFSAALSAVDHGAKKVLLADKAPAEWAGGNSYFTAGAFRTVFHGLEDVLSFVQPVPEERRGKIDMEAYTEEDFWRDLMRVTEGRADKELGRVLVGESRETVGWLASKGIKFQLSFNRYHLSGDHVLTLKASI
jgi:tricarballylate dehydrogenase